jgi:hypothetical protein
MKPEAMRKGKKKKEKEKGKKNGLLESYQTLSSNMQTKSIGAQSNSHAPHTGCRPSSHQEACFLHARHFLLLSI